jgi:D-glycero-D-manno-heptose 1,7-bisphosphate phosphatase
VRRFVFLDRDGTLVPDTGYPHRPEDCRLLPGVIDGLRALVQGGYRLAVVTNQSGIGRGLFGHGDYEAFQETLEAELARQGIALAGSFYCPHAPDAGCTCRKPAPGLLLRAREVLGADLAGSWVIGDALRDAEAASRAGCRGAVLVGERVAADALLPPRTVRAPDLRAAAAHILRAGPNSGPEPGGPLQGAP